jgi:Family of unknown function (DUF6612)
MRKTTLFAAASAIAALVLAGCGAKQESGSPSTGGGSGGQEIKTLALLADKIGEVSAEKQGAHVSMSIEGGQESIKGEGDMRFGAKPAMDMTVAVPEMAAITMRFVDDAFYFKLPSELEPGKPWVKIDTNGDDPLSKALGAAVKQLRENGDPAQTLKQLKQAGEITNQKSEQLNGKDTTHYSITVDVQKLVDQQADADMKKLMEAAAQAGIKQFPLEVWVDKDNLPARISMDMPFNDPQTQKTQQVKMQIDYTDWGKPVNVAAPNPAEVAELPR